MGVGRGGVGGGGQCHIRGELALCVSGVSEGSEMGMQMSLGVAMETKIAVFAADMI